MESYGYATIYLVGTWCDFSGFIEMEGLGVRTPAGWFIWQSLYL